MPTILRMNLNTRVSFGFDEIFACFGLAGCAEPHRSSAVVNFASIVPGRTSTAKARMYALLFGVETMKNPFTVLFATIALLLGIDSGIAAS
jgi:hypothetical protein